VIALFSHLTEPREIARQLDPHDNEQMSLRLLRGYRTLASASGVRVIMKRNGGNA
jgi:hypothetical protein